MTHELKIIKEFADAVNNGEKTFEVRKNDRDYHVGDHIRFEVINGQGKPITHPLANKTFEITYISTRCGVAIAPNYIVFAIREV